MSVRRRPISSSNQSRPVSAIFLGRRDPSVDPDDDDKRSRSTLLPSPPHTNSNSSGGGSAADSGTVGRQAARFTPPDDLMSPSSSTSDDKGKRPLSRSSYHETRSPTSPYENNHDPYGDDRLDDAERQDESYDNEHTARLSDDRRSGGAKSSESRSTASASSGGATIERARTLADRNRAVLQKLAAITSSSRSSSRSPAHLNTAPRHSFSRERSPFMTPVTPMSVSSSSHASADSSKSRNRVSFPEFTPSSPPKPRASLDSSLFVSPASGSETEREPRSSDDFSVTPPAYPREHDARPSFSGRPDPQSTRRRDSSPSPPSTSVFIPSRQSSDSGAEPYSAISRDSESVDSPSTQSFGTSRYKSKPRRAPLPQAFRDNNQSSEELESPNRPETQSERERRFIRDHDLDRARTNSNFGASTSTSSSRASTSEHSSSNKHNRPPALTHKPSTASISSHYSISSPSHKRFSTVREPSVSNRSISSRHSHTRWASEAEVNGSATERPRGSSFRYEQRGGSAESAIAARPSRDGLTSTGGTGGRTLFSESIKAAGLSPKKERFESSVNRERSHDENASKRADARMSLPNGFADSIRGPSSRPRTREGVGTTVPDPNVFQRSPTRVTIGRTSSMRPSTSGDGVSSRFQQSVRAAVGGNSTSRPLTSAGNYGGRDRNREPPIEHDRLPPLTRHNVSLSSRQQAEPRKRSDSPQAVDRRYESPTFRPMTSTQLQNLTSSPSSGGQHPDILLNALRVLEMNLQRATSTSSNSNAQESSQSASVLVDQLRGLNQRLRAATSSALEEHIDADVLSAGTRDGTIEKEQLLREAEMWKTIGGEFRESLRASDELVRTLTSFLLSFGKVLKDMNSAGPAGGASLNMGAGSTGSNEDARYPPRTSSRPASRLSFEGQPRRSLDPGYRPASGRATVDEWGIRAERLAETSEVSRRSLDGFAASRHSLDSRPREREQDMFTRETEPYVRSSTALSRVSHRETRSRATPSPLPPLPLSTSSKKTGVFSSFSSKRLFGGSGGSGNDKSTSSSQHVLSVPPRADTTSSRSSASRDVSFEDGDLGVDSPTPASRGAMNTFKRTIRKSFPLSSERPLLSTVPSESRVQLPPVPVPARGPSPLPPLPPVPKSPTRRSKTSTTSNATVRGTSIQLSGTGALPTQLTTTPVLTTPSVPRSRTVSQSSAWDNDMNAHDSTYRSEVAGLAREIDTLHQDPEELDHGDGLPPSLSRAAGTAILAAVNQRPVANGSSSGIQRRTSISASGSTRRLQPRVSLNSSTVSRSRASSLASNSEDDHQTGPISRTLSRNNGRGFTDSRNTHEDELLSDSSRRRRGTIGALFG